MGRVGAEVVLEIHFTALRGGAAKLFSWAGSGEGGGSIVPGEATLTGVLHACCVVLRDVMQVGCGGVGGCGAHGTCGRVVALCLVFVVVGCCTSEWVGAEECV